MTGEYEDIIHLPHHVSSRRARMSPADRAAQFAPFAALTGYDAVVREAARHVEEKIELGPDAWQELDRKLAWVSGRLLQHPVVTVTWFLPDPRKTWGGSYETKTAPVRKVSRREQWLLLETGEQIPFGDLYALEVEEG